MSTRSGNGSAQASSLTPTSFAAIESRGALLCENIGELFLLAVRIVRSLFRGRLPWSQIARAIDEIGVRSFTIVTLTSLFTGLVLALQTGTGMARFGAAKYTGYVVPLAIVREMGPVLTALIVGGRVAGGMAAELGSMQVTDQLDALRAMGGDPIRALVLPRVLICSLTLPMLCAVADLVGLFAAALMTFLRFNVSMGFFFQAMSQTVRLSDIGSGLAKAIFFGFVIATIACHEGLTTSGGTAGVGRSTTRAVVRSLVVVLVLNFFLTKLFLML